MNVVLPLFALMTGLFTGAVFAVVEAPIPAPPSLAGVLGIFGIYLGYVIVEDTGMSIDLLSALGLA